MKTGVFAGNYQEFVDFCYKNNKNPIDPTLFFISGLESLRGLRNDIRVVRYGTFHERSDFEEINDELMSIEF